MRLTITSPVVFKSIDVMGIARSTHPTPITFPGGVGGA